MRPAGQQLAIFEPGILLHSEDGLDQPLPIALAEAVTLQDLSAHAGAIVASREEDYSPNKLNLIPVGVRGVRGVLQGRRYELR